MAERRATSTQARRRAAARRAAARRRARTARAGIRSRRRLRTTLIAVGASAAVLALLVAGVFAAGPLGEALRQAVVSAEGGAAPDAPSAVELPPLSTAVAAAPGAAGAPGVLAGLAGNTDVAWATRMAEATNVSVRAIQSYAGVALAKQTENPTCHLGWNTLAAVGSVESGNGTHGGSSIAADGQVSPPIYGIALDGVGVNNIPDSDKGAIDGDASIDRAVGPMQLIPEAWRNWGTDGSGDGVADPQNFDDSVLATANYLCYAGGDLSTLAGWERAIAAYNDATPYALKVSTAAVTFAATAARTDAPA
ncbi:lytic transglycosylase domain-containing protein [Subtercola boreus]|uniref:lytic transglycosylase domain-containing protein n=1 Tax=Subtercola boreus TaxID=120213 RepID=UPI00114FD68C|nr:lytic murein transglycosylase [Subtercola boreus]